MKINRVTQLLKRFKKKRIVVVGDLMLDRYVTGTVGRISPEAPVPVVNVTDERVLPGGAANVRRSTCSLKSCRRLRSWSGKGLLSSDQSHQEVTDFSSGRRGIAR